MAEDSPVDTPKKWWWLAAVAVPVIVAVIAIVPDMLPSGAGGGGDTFSVIGSQFNDEVTFNTYNVVVDQADEAGIELSVGELETLRQALNLAQARQFDAAIPLLQSLEEVAQVPAVLNNLGAAYLAVGDREAARRYFQATVAQNPNEQAAQINLDALIEPVQFIAGAKVVNFTSEYNSSNAAASRIVDGHPGQGWASSDGKVPQSFVIELPSEFLVSQFSFDNATSGEADRSVKSIEVSVSLEAPDLGYRLIRTFTLEMGEIAQGFKLDSPVRARWIKLRILSNHGNPSYTELKEVRVIGTPVTL